MKKMLMLIALGNLCVLFGVPSASASPTPSKIWPMSDEGAAWMIEGLPNAENIGYPVGDKAPGKLPPDWRAVVEAPAYVELLSNTYSYSAAMPAPTVAAITRDGKPYKRYTFTPLSNKNYDRWASFFTHWVPRPTDADRKAPGLFAWRFVTPDGEEPEQALPIKLLPELPEFKAPRRLQVRLWQSTALSCQPEKLKPVLTLLQRSGFNTICWWESPLDNLLKAGAREMGLKIAADQSGHAGWPEMATPSPAPEYQNRDNEGRELKEQDPQWVIDSKGEPWKNDLAYGTRQARLIDVQSQDIEWNPGGFNTGFSPAGIRAFALQNKLEAAPLTPQIIWSKYRKQWNDFRGWQTLELVKLYYKAAKLGNPNAVFEFLPGSPYSTTDPDFMSQMIPLEKDPLGRQVYLIFPYPLDRMSEAMDINMPMWYGHGIAQTREGFTWSRAISGAVKTPLIPTYLGQGREFYYPGGDPGEVLRAMNAAAILGGSKGVCYWLGEFSPLQLWWLARGWREIAAVEDILLDGTEVSSPGPLSPGRPAGDGEHGKSGVTVTPLPKKTFTLVSGKTKRAFPVPDFATNVIWRAFAKGSTRLVGFINLDPQYDAYYRLSVSGLPAEKTGYRLVDVSDQQIIGAGTRGTLTAAELREGVVLRTPARYGVNFYVISPAREPFASDMKLYPAHDDATSYAAYREPDTTGAVLAERAGMSIRYDIVGEDKATAILIETPQQQVWVRLQSGGRISDWKIKEGNRTVVRWVPPYGGAGADLFWSPADAHWTGDELGPYELVSAKIHGGKAYLQMRQKKQTPSLQGLVVTKTIAVPADRTDIEVNVVIENQGPAPEVGLASWQHHMFQIGAGEGGKLLADPARQHPQIIMKTANGPAIAPLKEIVWAKPGAGYLPGNETWEKSQRNGETTGDWIAQRDPATGEAVLCQVDSPAVTQFYSWRDANALDDLSVEWMSAYLKLPAGQSWRTGYVMRYLKTSTVEGMEGRLLPKPEG